MNGFFIQGLKSLKNITFLEHDHEDGSIFKCNLCNEKVEKTKLLKHFKQYHNDVYEIIIILIKAWGLSSDVEINNKRYYCECGKNYASYAGLYRHRKNENHRTKINNSIPVEIYQNK